MGWRLLRLSAKILALLRLSVNFFQLRLTKKLKINFYCFKELNINKPVFFVSSSKIKVLGSSRDKMKLFFFLRIEMSIVSLKIIFVKKQKQTRERPTQGRGARGHSFITEMTVFTQETDYSCETGYWFDNSRQIGNTS